MTQHRTFKDALDLSITIIGRNWRQVEQEGQDIKWWQFFRRWKQQIVIGVITKHSLQLNALRSMAYTFPNDDTSTLKKRLLEHKHFQDPDDNPEAFIEGMA